jgi:hypothetical protein
MQSRAEQTSWFKGVFMAHIFHYKMTKIQEAKEEALFQQAAVSSPFCKKKWLHTTPWVDAIQQNTISKKYYNKIISQSITLQSLNLSWLL